MPTIDIAQQSTVEEILAKVNSGSVRANDYCTLKQSTTTVQSAEKTTSVTESSKFLVGSYTIPSDCISYTLQYDIKVNSASGKAYLQYAYIDSSTGEEKTNGSAGGVSNTSYETKKHEYDVSLTMSYKENPTRKLYLYVSGNSYTAYIKNVKVIFNTPKRTVTTTLYPVGELFMVVEGSTDFTTLPRVDRCELTSYVGNSMSDMVLKYIVDVDGVKYLTHNPSYTFTVVKY